MQELSSACTRCQRRRRGLGPRNGSAASTARVASATDARPRCRARRMGLYAGESSYLISSQRRYAATLLADDALLLRQFAACFDDAEDADDVRSRRPAVLRWRLHDRRDSCPSDEVVAGFFFDFEAVRTEPRDHACSDAGRGRFVKLADVAKLVVLLNEPPLVEALLDQPLFEPFLGALEYAADLKQRPDASMKNLPNHR